MSIRDNLQAGSYKGVPFIVPAERESAGKKVAIHEFPGSDSRFVEELGALLPTFTLPLIVHGPTAVQQRARLSTALNSTGAGILVHPYLGRRRCMAVDWTVSTDDRTVGEILFDVTFVQTDEAISLNPTAGGIQAVFSAADRARAAIDVAFGERYLPVQITATIKEIGARVRESTGLVQSVVSRSTNPIADSLNALNSEVTQTQGSVLSIVRTPVQVVDAFRGVFNAALSVANTPGDLAAEWLLATEFGSPPRFLSNGQISRPLGGVRDVIKRTTGERVKKDTNLRLIDQRMRIEALINWMEAEADRDFTTVDDLVQTREAIDAAFRRIVIDQDDAVTTSEIGDVILTDENVTSLNAATLGAIALDESLAFDPDLRDTLTDLKAAVLDTISISNKNPYLVETIDIGASDVFLATYDNFGSLDLLDDIRDLNSDINLAFFNQPIRVVLP